MNRSLLILLAICMSLVCSDIAFAGDTSSGAQFADMLVVGLIILLVLVCFLGALSVFSILKGGELASGWQTLAISFIVLLIAEGLNLLDLLKIVELGSTVILIARLIAIGMVMMGITRIKKVLS